MKATLVPRWKQLQSLEFNQPGAVLSFTGRLARENGWPPGYAERVTEEYRKFIFLSWISEKPLTPSDAVDQAWHLHLCYTRSYWIDLCKNILGRDLHHQPTLGGKQEAAKFRDFYAYTLALYREVFLAEAPADIWPSDTERFRKTHFQRVDLDRYWLIAPKNARRFFLLLSGLVFAGLFIQASESEVVYVILALAVLMLLYSAYESLKKKNRNKANNKRDGDCASGCTADGGSADSGCSADGCSGCGGGD